MLGLACFIIIVTGILFLAMKVRDMQGYFAKNDVPHVQPIFLLGSVPSSTFLRANAAETYTSVYEALSPHKIGGFYETIQPVFMVRDPDYVQTVLINNYSNFYDRGFQVDEKINPLDGHVFFVNGAKWRFLRRKMSPILTSKKIQSMYDDLAKCTDHFVEHLSNADVKEVDLKHFLLRFTVNVVASIAFGMELQRYEDEKSQRMFDIGKMMFSPGLRNSLYLMMRFMNPKFLSFFKIKTIPKEIDEYFYKIVADAFAHRLRTGETRNDVIQSLLQLREKGEATLQDAGNNEDEDSVILELDDKLLTAQAFIIFIGGSETTQNTLYSLLYLFSLHEEIQEKARQEVISAVQRHGSMSYEAIQDMAFLDDCFKETLRIFPPAPIHLRMCTKDFTFPDGTTVRKGNRVVIPAFQIQRDSNHFEDPLEFQPERFKRPPRPGTYLPFGDGPKICIGKKLADTEMKLLTARMLERFKIKPVVDSPTDLSAIQFEAMDFFLTPKGGYKVKLEKIV